MSVHSSSAAQSASYEAATPEFPRHVVTAVIVSHDGARWLPDALSGLLGQERPVQNVIGADTGSADDSAQLLAEAVGDQRVLHLARRSGFGTAVDEAVRAAPVLTPDDLPYLRRPSGWDPVSRTWRDEAYDMPELPHGDPVQWLWLLHDDCAPEPDALAELLRVADASPRAVIVGPKLRSWYDRRQLLETGVSIARSGRRWTGLDRREQDQGQHDQVRPVLSVSSAGMLIRRDVYEELGGFDRRLPLMRDDVDLCWRAQAAGHQVLIAPDAVLRHAEAAARERRPIDCVGRSVANPHRVDKAGAVYTLLTNTQGRVLPYVLLRLLLGTFLRVLAYLVGKVPGQALDELAGLFGTLLRPGKILAARKRRGRPAVDASELRPLFPPPGATVRATVEQIAGNLSGRAAPDVASAGRHGAVESGPGGDDADYLEIEQFARLKRIARKPAPVLFAVLLLVSLIACRQLLGSGALTGGALLPAPGSLSDLWSSYLDSWHAVGVGSTASAPPYLAVVALVSSVFLGSTGFAVTLLLVCSVPLAGLTAYFASRPLVASRLLRAWASIAYAFLPAAAGALAGGRLGTAVLAVLLPLMARAAIAASGLRLPAGTRPSWRATWAYTLLITFTMAFTPIVWPIAVLLGVGMLVLRLLGSAPGDPQQSGGGAKRSGGRDLLLGSVLRFLAVVLVPLLVLAPWSLALLTQPSRFFQEAGLDYGAGSASALDLIGLSPGGPKAVGGFLLFGIVLAALAATLRDDRQRAIRTAWAVALTGLLCAALGNGSGWTGPAMLVYGLALLCAAAIGAEGIRTRMASLGFGWKQPVAVLIALASLLAPLYAAASWMITGADGPLERRSPEQVPAFVAEESGSTDRARTLVLDGTPGHVDYSLVRGSGARLGDADLAAEAGEDTRLGGIVANLVAGSGADQTNQLGGYAIRYVLVRTGAPREMGRVLDATPGLTRLSQDDGSALWRVDRRVSRVSIVAPQAQDGTTAGEAAAPTAVKSGPVEAHTTIPAGPAGRVLRLAEAADEGWQATLDGTALKPVTVDGWAQGFTLPSDGGTLDLTHQDPLTHTLWLWGQGLLAVVLVVLALPGRRREIDDDLPEDVAAAQAAAASGDGRRARRLRAQAEAAGAPESPDPGAPAADEQPAGPPADPAPVQDAAPVGDPYAAVPQQQSYEDWQAAAGAPPQTGEPQPYPSADPSTAHEYGQYGQQYPYQSPAAPADPYAADPYQAGVYDPYGYGQQQPQHQPYDDGTEYPGYSGSYPEPRRDGSDQQ
ncbi:glycosyltransferase [Streptomyces sp. NPDC048506]|uniref:glycosyltransferase family 2 protein n=1 Tax=Streptomyces sp. NPDC048506 TaxID=3155028 RepID=UPI003432C37B